LRPADSNYWPQCGVTKGDQMSNDIQLHHANGYSLGPVQAEVTGGRGVLERLFGSAHQRRLDPLLNEAELAITNLRVNAAVERVAATEQARLSIFQSDTAQRALAKQHEVILIAQKESLRAAHQLGRTRDCFNASVAASGVSAETAQELIRRCNADSALHDPAIAKR
jgi:hypothetical protein